MNAAKYAEQEAYDRERARIWLQDLLGLDVQSDFFSELADGVLLCSIVNTIKPGTIKKVNSASKSKKLVAKRLENLNAFLFGCKRIGVYPSYQFEIQEFQERKREDKLIRCLLKLEEIARKAGIDPSKHGEIHIGSDEPGAPPSPSPSRSSAPAPATAAAAPPSPTVSPAKDQEVDERERKEKEQRSREEREREERERVEREREEREREREEKERLEREREEREREEREREERERREQERLEREAEEARLQREKEESERRAREEREEKERREAEEREERERREREERERKEKQQQEAEEKRAERERQEADQKSAREAKLRADREAREKTLREERERREAEEKDRREKEEKARKEREEKLKRDREQREKERKEKEEKEKERRAAEAGGLKSKLDLFGGAALKPPASRPSGPSSPKPSSPTPAEGGNARAFFSQMAGEPAKASGGGGKLTLAPGKKLTGTDALLYWSQTNTAGYAGVDIRDFTESWRDGLGFCALVHAHFPSEIDYNACTSKTPSERLELAFDAAGRMGVPPLLDPEDITDVKSVDARSLITYLGCLYKGFKR